MIPYGRQSINEADIEAVVEALNSDWLTTGPAVEAFEAAIAQTAHAKYATSVTSGTAALHVAYNALDLAEGDEIITTPLTFIATASTAVLLGAKIRFADIDPNTGNLNPAAAAAEVSNRTRAITAVDYAGLPTKISDFRTITGGGRQVLLIQDAAHSIGSKYGGVPVGSEADLTTFSFFPTKNLTTAEGGAIATNDEELARNCRRFKNHGLVRELGEFRQRDEGPWHQEVHSFGLNYRLPDVLAALGLSQLSRLGEFRARRQQIFDFYSESLQGVEDLRIPIRTPGTEPVWHLYPIRVPASRRRAIFERLRAAGVGVQVNYIPVYWHPVFQDMGYKRGLCPEAEKFYAEEISLPLHTGLKHSELEIIAEAVREAVKYS
ncbi:UDP-4-amino-4,6-dideoxy-N-acetyl-beta-L-altrosamine transaminase [Pseudarthrobacter phenanthrenivorans]|uniref:UDP-4-amino-4, 6-dideoxy-N-acetyl-beta-L-altrosamine transaminase n=1 Tax=Pseudarthrobacter phenanthrenivorans TaxID=361575 RepID=A0A3B0FNS2_PSEPS|nr:DegT/DnrJ/EryC1/StrS family aminotransferase [Pseudarthrobacter phenanthrenivorans]RKO21525.1 UDP-4-amino-4,6-dideoxy-N-acetyl-beta-L-altrosamine transaminase [Pseudarthrobacter phenanthrenivorans]TPV52594.1 UDP-4-amino-4,6-dideoxy-N-acetyl-beta-L-altrosamine transaminase [Pseudarthrobacter phenanthrenivorans]